MILQNSLRIRAVRMHCTWMDFVSRMYLPEKGLMDTEGDFGVMIGVTTICN